MKILFLIPFFFAASLTLADNENLKDSINRPEFGKVLTIDNDIFMDGIGQIERETGVLFCRESAKGRHPDLQRQVLIALGKAVPISDILSKLQSADYELTNYGTAVHVSAPSIKKVKTNPLDLRVKNYQFSGTHEEFCANIPSLLPSGAITILDLNQRPSLFAKTKISIKIEGEMTLRQILMKIADDYKIRWSGKVSTENSESGNVILTFGVLVPRTERSLDIPRGDLPPTGDL